MRSHTALPADYHIHTPLCKHAEGDLATYQGVARDLGIPEICFTDHCPTPHGFDTAHRMELQEFPSYREGVLGLGEASDPRILFGVEADYYEGCEAFLARWLPLQGLDYVIGSVHFIDGWAFDDPEHRDSWETADVHSAWHRYFDLLGRLAESGLFDAVGHLDLPKKFGFRPPEGDLRVLAAPALDKIAGAGMGIEVNTSGLRKPVKEIYPSLTLLGMARERDIPICFGSDSHRPWEVGADFPLALQWVREAGYTHAFRVKGREKRAVPLP